MRRCDGQIGQGGFGEPMMLTPTAWTHVKPTDTRKVALTARVFIEIEYIGILNETVLKTDKKARTSAILRPLDDVTTRPIASPCLHHCAIFNAFISTPFNYTPRPLSVNYLSPDFMKIS